MMEQHDFDDFNSIKVRLEPTSIRSRAFPFSYFNSIKVRLERPLLVSFPCFRSHFNSIKVRLELEYRKLFRSKVEIFQFHKGTIRTGGSLRLC